MPAQRARLHLRQPPASRSLTLKRRDDEALSVGLELQIGLLRDPEQVQNGPIDDYPCTVSDGLQPLRHAFSMNNVHNVVQGGVRRTICRSAASPPPSRRLDSTLMSLRRDCLQRLVRQQWAAHIPHGKNALRHHAHGELTKSSATGALFELDQSFCLGAAEAAFIAERSTTASTAPRSFRCQKSPMATKTAAAATKRFEMPNQRKVRA
jgi:hypothetical protein